MKYLSRSNTYKAANCSFSPDTVSAYSYAWWKFTTKIGQLTVFNSFPYSVTTRKHQSKVRQLMRENGIDIHADIEAPAGFQSQAWAESAIQLYSNRIEKLRLEMLKGRPAKNLERAASIKGLEAKIKQVKNLRKMEVAQC